MPRIHPRNRGDGLRVIFVITRADSVGGATIHVRDLARALLEAGHSAKVLVGGEGPVTEAFREAGVPYRSLRHLAREINLRNDLAGLLELRVALRDERPDLVSTHTSKAGFLGRLAAAALGIPAIYTPHCWSFADGFSGASLYLWAERLARPFGRRIIAVSEAERQEGIARRVGPPEHFATVNNGMPDIPENLRANPGISPPRIVMVGRLEPQKDHPTLLQALAQLKNLPWTLDCIGDGPLRSRTESTIQELDLVGRVNLLGYRRDVVDLLSRAQMFVLATNWESFPRSILEAMRAGLPVVATAVGGNAEAVSDRHTGYLVPRGDANELAWRLCSLVADPVLRVKFGAAGRRRYEANFTHERMVERTMKIWESVLNRSIAASRRANVSTVDSRQPASRSPWHPAGARPAARPAPAHGRSLGLAVEETGGSLTV